MRYPLGWACPSPDELSINDLHKLLNAVAEAGYSGIEPLISEPYHLEKTTFRRMLQDRNLRLIGVRTGSIGIQRGLSLSHPDRQCRAKAISALSEVIEFCADLGKPKILVGLLQGVLDPHTKLSDALEWIAEGIQVCAEVARSCELEIDVEPINRYELGYNQTVAEVLALIDRIAASNVKLLLDSFHMNLEERSILAALKLAGNRIGHIHLADSDRRVPGQGTLDFATFFDGLARAGYQGSITVECESEDYLTDIRRAKTFLLPFLEV